MIDSERYTQYLKDNGIYIPDQQARLARERLEKAWQLQDEPTVDKI
jgi:hypothetical protein